MSDAPSVGDSTATYQRREGNWLISAILVTLTFVVAAACMTMLAVTLIQSRAAGTAVEGASVSIRKLDFVGRKWAVLQAQLDESAAKLNAESGQTAELASQATITAQEKDNRFKRTEGLLVKFHTTVRPFDEALVNRIINKGHDVQVNQIVAAKPGLIAKEGALGEPIDEIERAYRRYVEAQHKAGEAEAKRKANEQKINHLTSETTRLRIDLDRQFELIKVGLGADKDARVRVENVFYELNIHNFDCGRGNRRCGAIGGPFNRGLYQLLTFPPDLLTLILVILMGVLGSALQMSHAYFIKSQVQTFGGYFQRLSVGAITALVIFVVAKAGVPVIADPSRLADNAPINPYFVSFLAIVSGLLSENAIANVQAQGARLFGAAGPKRWLRKDFTEEIKAAGLTVAEIAATLGVNETTAAGMLQGKLELEPEHQKLITVYLRKSARELFTDIPPPPPARTAAPPVAPAPTTTPAPPTTTPAPASGR